MDVWEISAAVWQWPSGNWFFLTVPDDVSDEIAEAAAGHEGGFGSVRVEVTCGATIWRTSLFPSKSAKAYVLPMKRSIREAERLAEGTTAYVRLLLLDVGSGKGS
ncbi:MAG: DUF1905 domain-containing protein [Dermatophilaceae bacterium]|nr:DUF1905 domain-containing protein [Intrasporangiaceae bacterium]